MISVARIKLSIFFWRLYNLKVSIMLFLNKSVNLRYFAFFYFIQIIITLYISLMQALTTEDAASRAEIMARADAAHAKLCHEAQQALEVERQNLRQSETFKEQLRAQATTMIATDSEQLREALAQSNHHLQQERKFAQAHHQFGE